jgi:hypothetical protein
MRMYLNARIIRFGIFLTILSMTGCAGDQRRDSDGAVISLSEPRAITADQTDLNIAMFINPRNMKGIERTIRDNRGVNERIDLVGTNETRVGRIYTQRVRNGFFSRYTVDDLNDPDKFRLWVEKSLQSSGFVSQRQAEKAHNVRSRNTAGFKTVATVAQGRSACFIARTGYRLEKITIYDNDENDPDTIVEIIYCDQAQRFADFELLVSNVAIMEATDALTIRKKLSSGSASNISW